MKRTALGMDEDKIPTEFTIRPLRENDLLRITELCSPNMANVLGGVDSINAMQNSVGFAGATRNEAWIVEAAGRLIGLALIAIEQDSLAHLNSICVASDLSQRRKVTKALVERVMRHTWENGCLKLIVHTSLPADRFIQFMHAFGFNFSRERRVGNEHVVEFYRNLYERPQALGGAEGVIRGKDRIVPH